MVFVSSNGEDLVTIIEILLKLLYPFNWCGIYIPFLPDKIFEIGNIMTPLIIGVNRINYEKVPL